MNLAITLESWESLSGFTGESVGVRLGARGGSFIHSAGKLRRENCDWQKVYTGVICSAGSFALLLRFLLNTHRLVAFRSYYPPWGHSGQQTEPCRFLGYSASRPHFLLSLCPAARLLSIFDRFHFIFFPSVFFFFFACLFPIIYPYKSPLLSSSLLFSSHFSSFFTGLFLPHPRYPTGLAGRAASKGNV